MATKLNIFILQSDKQSVQNRLIDSFSHNNCVVKLFDSMEELFASSWNSPELIVLDEPISKIEKKRLEFKFDQNFPSSEVVYLSEGMFETSKSISQYKIENVEESDKVSVAIDEMLYYITYHEHFDTDTLVISQFQTQRYLVPLGISLLTIVLGAALYFA